MQHGVPRGTRFVPLDVGFLPVCALCGESREDCIRVLLPHPDNPSVPICRDCKSQTSTKELVAYAKELRGDCKTDSSVDEEDTFESSEGEPQPPSDFYFTETSIFE